MSQSILKVRGIGPTAAAILAENGIATAEDLATRTVLQVAAIKGFSEIRAAQVIADAKALIAADGATPEAGSPLNLETPVKKKKTPKKEGKKDKEKTKKKDKEKNAKKGKKDAKKKHPKEKKPDKKAKEKKKSKKE